MLQHYHRQVSLLKNAVKYWFIYVTEKISLPTYEVWREFLFCFVFFFSPQSLMLTNKPSCQLFGKRDCRREPFPSPVWGWSLVGAQGLGVIFVIKVAWEFLAGAVAYLVFVSWGWEEGVLRGLPMQTKPILISKYLIPLREVWDILITEHENWINRLGGRGATTFEYLGLFLYYSFPYTVFSSMILFLLCFYWGTGMTETRSLPDGFDLVCARRQMKSNPCACSTSNVVYLLVEWLCSRQVSGSETPSLGRGLGRVSKQDARREVSVFHAEGQWTQDNHHLKYNSQSGLCKTLDSV